MATDKRLPFRRRTFLIKHGFQIRFAVYPLLFLGVFLGLAGVYLYRHLQEVLGLQLYLPHSRLQDPWQVVAPALGRVAAWGGGAFLLALSAWVWGRFARLRRDLERLADWLNGLNRGETPEALPHLADREVRLLGEGLEASAQAFDVWRRNVVAKASAVVDQTKDPAALRRAIAEVREAVDAVRLEEDLS